MPVCGIVKTITPRCRRPSATVHQGVNDTEGKWFDYTTNMPEITVLLSNPFDDILSSVSCMELLPTMRSFFAKQKISLYLLSFTLKMFR